MGDESRTGQHLASYDIPSAGIARARCVVLTRRGTGEDIQHPGSLPTDLLRVLRRRSVELHIHVDAHAALACIFELEHTLRADHPLPLILLIVEPELEPLARRLQQILSRELPEVAVWRYQHDAHPPLQHWPAAQTSAPSLRLTGIDASEPSDHAPENPARLPNHPRAPARPSRPRHPHPPISDAELKTLLTQAQPPGVGR